MGRLGSRVLPGIQFDLWLARPLTAPMAERASGCPEGEGLGAAFRTLRPGVCRHGGGGADPGPAPTLWWGVHFPACVLARLCPRHRRATPSDLPGQPAHSRGVIITATGSYKFTVAAVDWCRGPVPLRAYDQRRERCPTVQGRQPWAEGNKVVVLREA